MDMRSEVADEFVKRLFALAYQKCLSMVEAVQENNLEGWYELMMVKTPSNRHRDHFRHLQSLLSRVCTPQGSIQNDSAGKEVSSSLADVEKDAKLRTKEAFTVELFQTTEFVKQLAKLIVYLTVPGSETT